MDWRLFRRTSIVAPGRRCVGGALFFYGEDVAPVAAGLPGRSPILGVQLAGKSGQIPVFSRPRSDTGHFELLAVPLMHFPDGHTPNRNADFHTHSDSPSHRHGNALYVISSWDQPWLLPGPTITRLNGSKPCRFSDRTIAVGNQALRMNSLNRSKARNAMPRAQSERKVRQPGHDQV
jgi:hypothetical protein